MARGMRVLYSVQILKLKIFEWRNEMKQSRKESEKAGTRRSVKTYLDFLCGFTGRLVSGNLLLAGCAF